MDQVIAALNLLGDFTHGRKFDRRDENGGEGRDGVILSVWLVVAVFPSVWKRLSHKRPPHC